MRHSVTVQMAQVRVRGHFFGDMLTGIVWPRRRPSQFDGRAGRGLPGPRGGARWDDRPGCRACNKRGRGEIHVLPAPKPLTAWPTWTNLRQDAQSYRSFLFLGTSYAKAVEREVGMAKACTGTPIIWQMPVDPEFDSGW